MYRRLMFRTAYRSPFIILFTFLAIVNVIGIILYLLVPGKFYIASLPFPIIVLAFIPYSSYTAAHKTFYSIPRRREKTVYEFTNDIIKITSKSFRAELEWNAIQKIEELNNWILFYHNKSLTNFIPKDAFGIRLNEFRQLVKSKPSVELSLPE